MADATVHPGGSRRTVIAASVGTLIEGYDLLLYGYFAGTIAARFFPTGNHTAALLNTFAIYALGFAVRPIGGVVFGHLGDRFGRRRALAVSMLTMAAGTLAIGVLPTYRQIGVLAPVLLLLCRLVQGVSVAGEYVGANLLILEGARAGRLARTVSANQVAVYVGVAAAAGTSLLTATLLTPAQLGSWGWRLPFVAAVPLALLGLYVRLRVPDDPRFTTEARPGLPIAVALRTAKRPMAVFAGWLGMVTVGGFLMFGYMPTYLTQVIGFTLVDAFAVNLVAVLAAAGGAVAGGRLLDRNPTGLVPIACAAATAVVVLPGFLLIQQGTVVTAAIGHALWTVLIGAGATLSALLSVTLFPAAIRFTAAAVAYNVTVTVFGGTAPYVSAWLVARLDTPLAPAGLLIALALLALLTAVTALRRRLPVRDQGEVDLV